MLKIRWKFMFTKLEYLLSPFWGKLGPNFSKGFSTGKSLLFKGFSGKSELYTPPTTTPLFIFKEKRLILREVI